jgi:hypothetical protein
LPPRKPKKTGKTCPSTTATAALPITAGGASRARGTATAVIPLITSKASTATPAFLPAARMALVAPALPLPTVRTSSPCRTLTSTTLKETEPSR